MEEQGLTSIGEQTKKYMSDFDDIRQLTMDSIRTHRKNTNVMQAWKKQIRQTLLDVREEFMFLIDDYTEKFVSSLRDID